MPSTTAPTPAPTTTPTMSQRADELARTGVPFVQATVVRAQGANAARPGDRAIILADGSMEGFVGGHCAAGSVRTAALGALSSGESTLLRVLPDDGETFPESPGATVVVNPCLSGGALEIYLEPLLPSPRLHIVGSSPTANAVAALAPAVGFVVDRAEADAFPTGPTGPTGAVGAVVVLVSSHGGDELGAVRRALDADVGFIGVVCSRTRGQALLDDLALPDDEAARVHVHVGLDIGARTAPEVAVSILAELVREIRTGRLAGPVLGAVGAAQVSGPTRAIDPVCGMTVTTGPDTAHAVVDGIDHWFCMPGCRDTFLEDHAS